MESESIQHEIITRESCIPCDFSKKKKKCCKAFKKKKKYCKKCPKLALGTYNNKVVD